MLEMLVERLFVFKRKRRRFRVGAFRVDLIGLEPTTSTLPVSHSTGLSYRPLERTSVARSDLDHVAVGVTHVGIRDPRRVLAFLHQRSPVVDHERDRVVEL